MLNISIFKIISIEHFFTEQYNITSSDTWDVGLKAANIKRVRNSSPY
jgi:hypothetical protein